MGYKRRREQYAPRLNPVEVKIQWLRQHIAQIGEPSRLSREAVMRTLIQDLHEVGEKGYSSVLQTLKATIYEQPHKICYLGYVLIDCPPEFAFLALEMAHDEAQRSLSNGEFEKFKVFFRFLCAMHPVIANCDVLTTTLKQLVLSGNPQLYKAALLASVYLPPSQVTPELQQLFCEQPVGKCETDIFDPFLGEKAPYKMHHIPELLQEAAVKLREANWEANVLPKNPLVPEVHGLPPKPNVAPASKDNDDESYEPPSNSEDTDALKVPELEPDEPSEASEANEPSAPQHVISELVVPADLPKSTDIPSSPAFFQCYLPVDGVDLVPPPATIAGILLRDVAIDNMRRMDFNRREVTRQLIALDLFFNRVSFAAPGTWPDQIVANYKEQPSSPTYKIEDIALEAVFSQMFDLAAPSTPKLPPLVYYHSLLIEACVIAPQDIAPVLGRGLRFMFNYIESADAEVLFRSVDWFAHHVSNFAFTWKWNEWLDTLQLPRLHPQQVFVRELVAKQVRLSYAQRVQEVLPEEFQPLVPHPPDVPDFKYSDVEVAQKLVEALSTPDLDATAVMNEYDGNKGDLLVTTVCHLGNRSVTHATTWIAKTESLVREYATSSDIVNAVFEYWAEAPWVGALVINQFIKSQLLNGTDFVKYVVNNQELLVSSLGWEVLCQYLDEAAEAIGGINLEGEYADWWNTKLKRAIARKVEVKAVEAVAAAEAATAEAAAAEATAAEAPVEIATGATTEASTETKETTPTENAESAELAESDGEQVESQRKRVKTN